MNLEKIPVFTAIGISFLILGIIFYGIGTALKKGAEDYVEEEEKESFNDTYHAGHQMFCSGIIIVLVGIFFIMIGIAIRQPQYPPQGGDWK